jgi:hypothetical protein
MFRFTPTPVSSASIFWYVRGNRVIMDQWFDAEIGLILIQVVR